MLWAWTRVVAVEVVRSDELKGFSNGSDVG